MDLSIIIVNYKSQEKLKKCLAVIFNSDLPNINYEVIVVENNSGDNLKPLLGEYSSLKIIKSPKNLGMGGGNNLGIEMSQGEYLLILNPDSYVEKDAIGTLFTYLDNNSEVQIVGPKLLNTDRTLQYSCARFPRFYMPILRRTFLGDYFKSTRDGFLMSDFDHNSIKEVDWLMGSCLMMRKNELARFDERFFMYFEDVDLCRRAKVAKKKVVYNPEAIVIHDHQRQSARYPWYRAPFKDKMAREHIKSWLKYFLKWRFRRFRE